MMLKQYATHPAGIAIGAVREHAIKSYIYLILRTMKMTSVK